MREAPRRRTNSASGSALSLEARIAGAEKVDHHKTSMLQDIESGRVRLLEAA